MAERELSAPAYIVNGDSSQTSVLGAWQLVRDLVNISFAFKWTAANGTIAFEVSNDTIQPTSAGGAGGPGGLGAFGVTTPALPAGQAQPAGGAGIAYFLFTITTFPRAMWMRGKFTRGAGGAANDLFCAVHGQGIG